MALSVTMTAMATTTHATSDMILAQLHADDLSKVAPDQNGFGFKLFGQLLQTNKDKNILISPVSLTLALAMTYNGAKEETATAIQKTLGVAGKSPSDMNQLNQTLLKSLTNLDPKVKMALANSLWVKQGVELKEEFKKISEESYGAKVTAVDFANAKTASDINGWVKANTGDQIDNIVTPPIDPQTALFLLNAIYFKGTWTMAFDPTKTTRAGEFTSSNGKKSAVPLMSQKSHYSYYEGDDYQAVRLPYGDSEAMSMVIFLPQNGQPVEQFPWSEKWVEWHDKFSVREGNILLPQFKVEYDVTLKEALTALGMGIAFEEGKANFGGIAKLSKEENLYISQVKHKTFVEVNEEGTEAAASTQVEFRTRGMAPAPFVMEITHPFLFVIQEEKDHQVLFMGAIVSL